MGQNFNNENMQIVKQVTMNDDGNSDNREYINWENYNYRFFLLMIYTDFFSVSVES